MTPTRTLLIVAALSLVAQGCGDDAPDPTLPADYQATFTEVRDCRANGGSHDFNRIRVLAGPTALAAYRDRNVAFPVGSMVVKEEYDPNDTLCDGPVTQWTVMERLPAGNEATLNWHWQRLDGGRNVMSDNEPRCFGCHADCVPPDGYENTCTVP